MSSNCFLLHTIENKMRPPFLIKEPIQPNKHRIKVRIESLRRIGFFPLIVNKVLVEDCKFNLV